MRKFAHIIHPVVVASSSDLNVAQPVTFDTMRIAREFASGQVQVVHLYTKYADEVPPIPEGFQRTPDLERSVWDVATFRHRRKLALIKDILDRLYEATDAEYLVYTNVDIALLPHFYVVVDRLIDQGYDALIINRRTISKAYQHPEDIPLMYAQIGEPHPGHDCFVFQRSVYPHYRLGTTCIGAGRIGAVLAVNLIYNAAKFKEFRDLHLTLHIGNDKVWRSQRFADYFVHNENELKKVIAHYSVFQDPRDDPIIEQLVARYGMDPIGHHRTRGRLKRIVDKVKRWISLLKAR
ncbi:MAG: hypothetical protein ACYTEQ_07935 [Planctomycetota bacterium]